MKPGATTAAMLVTLLASAASAQEAAGSVEARAQALAAEQLAPLLQALGHVGATAAPEGVRFLVHVQGNAQGLEPGVPVTIRGLRVGTVREVTVALDSGTGQVDVPTVIDIVPGVLMVDGQRPETEAAMHAAIAQLVGQGLRARLAGASLLSSSRELTLEMVGDAAPAVLGEGPLPEIPSLPTRVDDLSATLDKVLAEVARLPLDRLFDEVEATLTAVHDVVTAPELRQAVVNLAGAAVALRGTVGQLAERADPLIASFARTMDQAGPATVQTIDAARAVLTGPELREALANLTELSAELRNLPAQLLASGQPLLTSATNAANRAGQAAGEAQRTLGALDATFGSRSNFQSDLETLLREVTGTMRSLHQLLDLLNRQPNVLLRGKQGGPPP